MTAETCETCKHWKLYKFPDDSGIVHINHECRPLAMLLGWQSDWTDNPEPPAEFGCTLHEPEEG